jgi:hypothetical protein
MVRSAEGERRSKEVKRERSGEERMPSNTVILERIGELIFTSEDIDDKEKRKQGSTAILKLPRIWGIVTAFALRPTAHASYVTVGTAEGGKATISIPNRTSRHH